MVYGYCRISTKKQSIERQERNILRAFPDAVIYKEAFTGTTTRRPEFDKLLKRLKPGDVVVFDSVSRMSRNADEGFELYEKLYSGGISLVFLKEPHINTETYQSALSNNLEMTGTDVDYILQGVNHYLMALAKTQIRLAFEQAEKEVMDLRQRTKEGIETARSKGKQIGQLSGKSLTTKKSIAAKAVILKHSMDFNGTLSDEDVMKLAGIARNTYYKYKRELKEEP